MKKIRIFLLVLICILFLLFSAAISGGIISFIYYPYDKFTVLFLLKNGLFHAGGFFLTLFFLGLTLGTTIFIMVRNKYFNFNSLLGINERSESNLHDDAEFMTIEEMNEHYGQDNKPYNFKDLGSSDFHGYIVNSYFNKSKFELHGVKKQHGLIIGTNGTGKSAFLMGPTIQANAISKEKPTMIINDMKGELFSNHSKVLADNGYNVLVINLRTTRQSLRFNPLAIIWDLYHEFMDQDDSNKNHDLIDNVSNYIQAVVETIVPIGSGDNVMWNTGAQGIITGIIWAFLEDSRLEHYNFTKDMFTIEQISNVINSQPEFLEDFLANRDKKTSKVFANASVIIGNKSEKNRASFISTVVTALKPYLESGITYVMSASDFSLQEIVDKPTALFIIIPDESKTRYPLANMIISQIYSYLTFAASKTENITLDRTVYFMLDEFGNMPMIPNFESWISLSRGRNIFFLLVLQAISQLNTKYGKEETITILQNCHLQLYIGASEPGTLEYFQKLLGTYTVQSRSVNHSSELVMLGDSSGQVSLAKKDLVTQSELQLVKKGNGYFNVQSHKPVKAKFIPTFDPLAKTDFFKFGSVKNTITEKHYNPADNFFSLEDRANAFFKYYSEDGITPSDLVNGSAAADTINNNKEVQTIHTDIVENTHEFFEDKEYDENLVDVKPINPEVLSQLGVIPETNTTTKTTKVNEKKPTIKVDSISRLKQKMEEVEK